MRLTGGTTTNNEKGFTLVELMVTLSIMGIVLAAAYNFFFFTHKSYALADARSAAIQEVDLLFLQLEKDIRSASAPNSTTRAVTISNDGQQIDIYSTKDLPSGDDPDVLTSHYCLTSYRLNGTEIQKGFTSSAEQSNSTNPEYGGIPDIGEGAWETIVDDVLPGEAVIFSDRYNGDNISSRRLIDVDLFVKPAQLNNSINMKTSLLSRTGRSTASLNESIYVNTYKEATIIKFYDEAGEPITNLSLPKDTPKKIVAKAFASDGITQATNKNILFKQNIGSILYIKFPDYEKLYEDNTGEYLEEIDLNPDLFRERLTARSGQAVSIISSSSLLLKGRIEAESPDGASAILKINY